MLYYKKCAFNLSFIYVNYEGWQDLHDHRKLKSNLGKSGSLYSAG